MIGRKHAHDGVFIESLHMGGGPADARCGVAPHRLGEDLMRLEFGELLRHLVTDLFGGHDEGALGR